MIKYLHYLKICFVFHTLGSSARPRSSPWPKASSVREQQCNNKSPWARTPTSKSPWAKSPWARTPTSKSPWARTPTSKSPWANSTPKKPQTARRGKPFRVSSSSWSFTEPGIYIYYIYIWCFIL